jgi:transposase
VLEVGTHSPWVSRLLAQLGHEVIVANARRVRLIGHSHRKDDRTDAAQLARLGRMDPSLLAPIRHRGLEAHEALAVVRGRDALIRSRTQLINHVRGAVKAWGAKLPRTTAPAFHHKAADQIPEPLQPALQPLLEVIGELTARIGAADHEVEALCARYPETAALRQVVGVGPLTALTYVLTIEDPARFTHSRDVGPYLGLVPRRRDSGGHTSQLGISKAGDPHLRRLLVGCAHYILGPFGPDSDLRRWGERYSATGASNARKRAVIAVARRLAVLLHALWVSGEVYEPLRHAVPDALDLTAE